jgi:hypothetical protein
VELEATRHQIFDIEKKFGTAVVDKIGVKRIRVPKGRKYRYALPLAGRR